MHSVQLSLHFLTKKTKALTGQKVKTVNSGVFVPSTTILHLLLSLYSSREVIYGWMESLCSGLSVSSKFSTIKKIYNWSRVHICVWKFTKVEIYTKAPRKFIYMEIFCLHFANPLWLQSDKNEWILVRNVAVINKINSPHSPALFLHGGS